MYIKDTKLNRLINYDNFDYMGLEKEDFTSGWKIILGKCPLNGSRGSMYPPSSGVVNIRTDLVLVVRSVKSEEEALSLYSKLESSAINSAPVVEI